MGENRVELTNVQFFITKSDFHGKRTFGNKIYFRGNASHRNDFWKLKQNFIGRGFVMKKNSLEGLKVYNNDM